MAAANVRAWTRGRAVRRHRHHGGRLRHDAEGLRPSPGRRCRTPPTPPSRTRDILEFIGEVGLPPVTRPGKLSVAYHAPCSLQHGQGIKAGPAALLAAGRVRGAADRRGPPLLRLGRGLQHPAAGAGRAASRPQGGQYRAHRRGGGGGRQCRLHRPDRAGGGQPVIHPVELLDWATGGPKPAGALAPRSARRRPERSFAGDRRLRAAGPAERTPRGHEADPSVGAVAARPRRAAQGGAETGEEVLERLVRSRKVGFELSISHGALLYPKTAATPLKRHSRRCKKLVNSGR